MKKILIITTLLFSFSNLFSQNYYYSKRVESLKYRDSNGKNKSKVIKANTGNFKLYFEKNGIEGKDIFTEYINDNEMAYYALIEKYNDKELNGKIYEQGLFFSTENQDGVTVANTVNKDRLIIFSGDKIIQYDK
jgi:hypothetical protein